MFWLGPDGSPGRTGLGDAATYDNKFNKRILKIRLRWKKYFWGKKYLTILKKYFNPFAIVILYTTVVATGHQYKVQSLVTIKIWRI